MLEEATCGEDEAKCERCLRGCDQLNSGCSEEAGPTYEVRENCELGRYLIAARNLAAGELVFRAAPIVSGLQPGSVPLCLGCYRPLPPPPRIELDYFRCPTCGWPLCSEDCVLSLRHQPECEATARSGIRVYIRDPERPDPLYDCVVLIRCLMLKRQAPAHWAQLAAMEAHEGKKRPPLQRRRARALCALLKARFGIPAEESEMLRLLAVLEVNAYEVRMPATNVQAVYPVACLPEHSCVPNTFRTFERDLSVCVRAAVPIPKGHHITVTYTDALWGTPERRANLFFSKHFLCSCDRCADPEELGTFLSALRCGLSGSADGEACPGPVLPCDPLRPPPEAESDVAHERWYCARCTTQRSGEWAREAAREASEAVHDLDESEDAGPQDYERLLTDLHRVMFPSHASIVDVKHTLLHLYDTATSDTSQLHRKEILCREVLSVADKLFPGICTLKGTTMFELAGTLAELCHRDENQSPENIGHRLLEASKLYGQSVWHLQWQPECQPEWSVAEQAHINMHAIQKKLRDLDEKKS